MPPTEDDERREPLRTELIANRWHEVRSETPHLVSRFVRGPFVLIRGVLARRRLQVHGRDEHLRDVAVVAFASNVLNKPEELRGRLERELLV